MTRSTITATLNEPIEKVWRTVTSLTDYQWRSDLGRVETIDDNRFIEYTPDGFATTFTITETKPYKRWAFDMRNARMHGHWIGEFTAIGNQTELTFTEEVHADRLLLRPFVKIYLKKQQAQYVANLKKALSL